MPLQKCLNNQNKLEFGDEPLIRDVEVDPSNMILSFEFDIVNSILHYHSEKKFSVGQIMVFLSSFYSLLFFDIKPSILSQCLTSVIGNPRLFEKKKQNMMII